MQTDRKLIANELLPIYQTTDTGEKVVDARELCGFLNVGRDFTSWMRERIAKYGFVENEDFNLTLTKTGERQNITRHEYILKLDMAKELAMVENNEQGRLARKYFIDVEKRFQNGIGPKVPLANMEHDRTTKLLQMLRMAERENLFTPDTERALRLQIAESILGEPIKSMPNIKSELKRTPLNLIEPQSFVQIEAPLWERWYLTKEIADQAGVSPQMIAAFASKHGLRTDEYSRSVKSDPRTQSGLVQIMYNTEAKDILLGLIIRHKRRATTGSS